MFSAFSSAFSQDCLLFLKLTSLQRHFLHMLCIFNVYSKKQWNFIGILSTESLCFYLCPSHLFSPTVHTVYKESLFSLCVQLLNGQLNKMLSKMEQAYTHTPTKSWYHNIQSWIMQRYRRDWTNKHTNIHTIKITNTTEETELINTLTFIQSKILTLPQHAIKTTTKWCKICCLEVTPKKAFPAVPAGPLEYMAWPYKQHIAGLEMTLWTVGSAIESPMSVLYFI